MNCALITDSVKILETAIHEQSLISREMIVAYARLRAWTQHWPSDAPESVLKLLDSFVWIKTIEPDRYIKQRRIALSALARELSL